MHKYRKVVKHKGRTFVYQEEVLFSKEDLEKIEIARKILASNSKEFWDKAKAIKN